MSTHPTDEYVTYRKLDNYHKPIIVASDIGLPVFIHRNLTLCHKKKTRQTVTVCQNKKTKG